MHWPAYTSFPTLTKSHSPEQMTSTSMDSRVEWTSYTSFPDFDKMYETTEETCICKAVMDLTNKKDLKTLTCGHTFHKDCIFRSFACQLKAMTSQEGPSRRASCPCCVNNSVSHTGSSAPPRASSSDSSIKRSQSSRNAPRTWTGLLFKGIGSA